ncbi:MAG: exodeoxyribonuclease VII large subunit, partial [Gemmatimonadales bacterium]
MSQPTLFEERQTAWSVSEVAGALRETLETALGQIWIKGELRELKTHRSGHWYFSLGDEGAQLRCVMWKTYSQRVRTLPEDGTEVYILARPSFWEAKGDLRLSAVTLLPTAGIGAQQLEYLRAREALARDGLLDPARKRPLPSLPSSIALITSLDGAALR